MVPLVVPLVVPLAVPNEIKPAVSVKAVEPTPVSANVEDKWPFIAGGLGILALLGGWIYTRRKKKDEDEDDDYVGNMSTEVVSPKMYVLEEFQQKPVVVQNVATVQETKPYKAEFKNLLPVAPIAVVEAKSQNYEFSNEELAASSLLDDLPPVPTPELLIVLDDFAPMPHVETIRFKEVPVHDMPYMEKSSSDSEFLLPTENTRVDLADKHSSLDSSTFELNFDPNENLELENLTKSLALDMPSLDEPTSTLDAAAYPVSLTYDPDEQLGIAKFYLGLQDYRGVWDMVHPLLNHERDDVKARAYELLSDIPEELREEWTASK